MSSPFPCSPVIRECSWKKTQIEKNIYIEKQKQKKQTKEDNKIISVNAFLLVCNRRDIFLDYETK